MLKSGQQFGLYLIKEVFEDNAGQARCCAEDPFFNREVSLNVYATEGLSETDGTVQLESLLERLALLDHVSLAPIYDYGLEQGCFYYTTACYSGQSLAQRMVTPLVDQQALKVLYDLTEAFDYADQLELGENWLSADRVYFADDGRAVLTGFDITVRVAQVNAGQPAAEPQNQTDRVPETLRQLGELLLKMLLGSACASDELIDDQIAKIDDGRIRRLVGRFLLPGEWHFASFAELLEDLRCFDEVEGQLEVVPTGAARELGARNSVSDAGSERSEKMVGDIRRLVAEKNTLQLALDSALYERNRSDNKLADGEHQLNKVRQEVVRAKEEASVAWELVAGQKYDRWRHVVWAVGGFLLGFILSGSYGYYYGAQARQDLSAKQEANQELSKVASWGPAEQPQQGAQVTTKVPVVDEIVTGVEESQQWWPAGSEFSAMVAIPVEEIKGVLGLGDEETGLSELLRQEVTATIQRWAESWAWQDLNGYFSVYSENYRPEFGRNLQEWRDMRSHRVSRPKWIKLDVDDIRLKKIAENRIQVRFRQNYRSDQYHDQTFKLINLIKEGGEWRILMERSLGKVSGIDVVGG